MECKSGSRFTVFTLSRRRWRRTAWISDNTFIIASKNWDGFDEGKSNWTTA